MNLTELISVVLLLAGGVFYLAGTVGLLRLPDVYSRLHALTKADNLGLGLIVAGLALQASSWLLLGKLLLIWVLVLLSGAAVAQLVARGASQRGIEPWKR